jgi:iron complex transport system substrate-binding protein
MLRRLILFLLLALLTPHLGACPAWGDPIRLTDLAGREVVLQQPARRLLLGEGRFIHALALLERQDPAALVAGWMGDFQRLDPAGYAQYAARFPQVEKIPLVGATSAESFSVERALALQPDLVVLSEGSGHTPGKDSDVVAQLARAGVPVVFIDFRSHPLADTAPSLRLLGQAIGRAREAEEFLQFQQAHLDRISARLAEAKPQRPSLLMEMRAGGDRPCCSSPGHGNLGEFVEFAGGKNLGAERIPGVFGQLNLEFVVAADPAVYVATGGGNAGDGTSPLLGTGVSEADAQAALRGTAGRAGIAGLSAVREGHAHALWHHFYNSPYNLLAVEALARWLHPKLFTDLDPAATLAEMNRRFLAVPLEGTFWTSLK